MNLLAGCTGWNGIEDWKCASKGCCYDNKSPTTVGTENIKVSQPVCFYPNGAQSNYDLHGSFAAAGITPRPQAIRCSEGMHATFNLPEHFESTLQTPSFLKAMTFQCMKVP